MNKEFLNVIVADHDEGNQIFFKNIFKNLKIDVKVQCFTNGNDLMSYLNSRDALIPEILFLNYEIPGKNCTECIKEIKEDFRFNNMVNAIYSDQISEEVIEDLFVQGVNIFIRKPENYENLKKVLTEVIAVNWQYHTSGLNKDNLIMKL
jgi:response regulator RpfG family c-di-GMP phosphodiesterase